MKICVTGATGFAGAGVVPLLLRAGHAVRALVRKSSVARLPSHPECVAVIGNPLSPDDLELAIDGCDAVIHMVGTRRKQIKETGLGYDEVDVASAMLMVERMRHVSARRLLLLSAGAIGHSAYVMSKQRAEEVVIHSGLRWTIFRPAFLLGPGQQWPRAIGPMLRLMGHFPDPVGDVARRAGNLTREELGLSMLWALDAPEAIGKILDVPEMRRTARLGAEALARAERVHAG